MKLLLVALALTAPLASQALIPPPPFVPACYGAEDVEPTEPFLFTLFGISGSQEQQVFELIINDDVLEVTNHTRTGNSVTLSLSVDESSVPQDANVNDVVAEKISTILSVTGITDGQWEMRCNKLPDTPRGGGSNGKQP